MRARMLAFITGLLLFGLLPGLPSADWLFLWPVCLLLLWSRSMLALPAAGVAGGLYALAHASGILYPDFSATMTAESITISGRVISLPTASEAVTRFNFRIESIDPKDKKMPDQQALATLGDIRLSWYYAPADIRHGERWQLRVRLKPPHGFMNPGGFDYESWLFQQRIRATGYVREHADNRLLQPASASIHSVRAHLRDQLESVLPARQAAWITALAIGDRSGLGADDWQILRSTGTSHLMAISGLHVGLVAALLFFPFRALWSLIPRATHYISAQRLALSLALLGAAGYAALAGFALPTQRALAMLTVFGLCVFWRRDVSLGDVLLWALFIVLLLDPFAGLNAGFWLSFIAVAVIGWGMGGRRLQSGLWWRYGRVQYVVALGLAPLLLFWFQEYPLLGVLANIVAVPWVSLLVVPALLAGVVMALAELPLAELAFHFAATALGYLWNWLEWLVQSGLALMARPAPAPIFVFAGLFGALLLLLPRAVPGRWLGILWILPLLWPLSTRPPPGSFNFTLLDVGQGLAAVVETREYVLVYDTGARFSDNFDAGTAVLIPYLRQQGIREVGTLVISHADNDHVGGAPALLDHFAAAEILTSDKSILADYPGRRLCQDGQRWVRDGVVFEVLHPGDRDWTDRNNASCVLKISAGGHALLLPGDIERSAEWDLLKRHVIPLRADVLVAPHHGSRSSSQNEFVAAVQPDIVLFASGYRNRYGFPDDDIIARYQQQGSLLLNTAETGAIQIHFSPELIEYKIYRHERRRFWHNRQYLKNLAYEE